MASVATVLIIGLWILTEIRETGAQIELNTTNTTTTDRVPVELADAVSEELVQLGPGPDDVFCDEYATELLDPLVFDVCYQSLRFDPQLYNLTAAKGFPKPRYCCPWYEWSACIGERIRANCIGAGAAITHNAILSLIGQEKYDSYKESCPWYYSTTPAPLCWSHFDQFMAVVLLILIVAVITVLVYAIVRRYREGADTYNYDFESSSDSDNENDNDNENTSLG